MRSTIISLVLVGAIGALAYLWWREEVAAERLTAELAKVDAETAHLAQRSVELRTTTAKTQRQLAARLTPARRSEEQVRQTLGTVVERLRQQRVANPPRSPRPPPPEGPSGSIFPELLGNEEYRTLASLQQRELVREIYVQHLVAPLALTPDEAEHLTDLLSDRQLALRAQNGTTNAKEKAEAEQAIQTLLGEARYKQYLEQKDEGPPSTYPFNMLERRLSYTETPLKPEQLSALVAQLALMPKNRTYFSSQSLMDKANEILDPAQLAAMSELQEENEAGRLRSQLPKSSELPGIK